MKKIVIAVDGTSGSGKSETFKKVAEKLNYEFIDTGLMYRAFTLLCLLEKIDFNDQNQIIKLIKKFDYQTKKGLVYLNGQEVTKRLSENDIVKYINFITPINEVREMMVHKQREIVNGGGFIEIGRDITSVVLPNADLKIFLDSSVEVRANRRYKQNQELDIIDQEYEQIKQSIINRDNSDKNRSVGPLKIVEDAWYIDNSNLSIDEVVNMVVKKVKEMEGE
ncbi:(d)CMP kinase [Mesoplasma photuris]|uniref:(d)CMP kinase n=1 Tax=Mesoplasma photuris TaxID=217731 RepID=UPI0004E18E98|nr:(d)CMP kinase [Mesoplasma photuris]